MAAAGMTMQTRLTQRSGLAGVQLPARSAARRVCVRSARPAVVAANDYPKNWLPKDPLVVGASLIGWFVPSNIGVPAFGGASLFGKFTQSIGANLAHFPTGPPLNDPFWLYLLVWHCGLFAVLFFGQIGVQARKGGYLD